ncbi:carbon catabolite repressor protein 4 homolog 6 isoform X2 [Gossypium arboreum]|uniref:carbon catabolite repressor protein 4 homolog 6 isoform X2 n=1 Tax=Gossypium arboreum TaxID=29729 RepID=UPI0022F17938|nr:carbon catabolite repressor protein 4 homolog 6 isoform X2 [Gossypium arboreum]
MFCMLEFLVICTIDIIIIISLIPAAYRSGSTSLKQFLSMRRCPHLRLKFLAATATADTTAMSSYQRPHRGGRNQWGRSFSDRTNSGGRGHLLTGDSNLDSVGEANLGFRRGNFSNQNSFQSQQFGYNPRPSSPYNQNQQFFRQPPPARPYNRCQPPRHPFGQNPAPKPFRPRNSKPWDYREWKYAGTPPPPRSDKFVVLSYNVLADYLASTHRNLYFHIPFHMMNWEWRMRNLMFEISLWSADILCFQEVDRFHDMEEQLNSMGYNGIWKMRTGRAIDGCAIFWRTSSSTNSNKVVICNIHVLYNPRRGEIKLGQVRRLLERAHSVSKSWDDAPVVLCGDFNCTPKSPLYNFISEQKLDLSEVNRDKVSGQASAEIPLQTYNPNSGAQSGNIPAQVPPAVDIKRIGMDKNDSHSDTKKQNNLDRNMKDASVNMSGSSETMQDLSDMSCNNLRMGGNDSAEYDEVTEIQCGVVDMQRFSPGRSSCPENVCSGITEMEHIGTDVTIHSNNGKALDDIVMNNHSNGITTDPELLSTSQSETSSTEPLYQTHLLDAIEVSPPNILACQSSESVADDHRDRHPVPSQVDFSGLSAGTDIELEEKMDNLSLEERSKTSTDIEVEEKMDNLSPEEHSKTMVESENIVEDNNAFVDALYGNQDRHPTNSSQSVTSDLDHSSLEFLSSQDSQFLLPSADVLDDVLPSLDSEVAEIEQTTYDPSSWSPKELATATGNEDCKFLEHPLQLKSTYTEVKDSPGTRDSYGEPLVTSYNRRFLGTVDYIWRSEGLQTVRVLAPIPKHAMQWTPGFPTKKWGSDHIALAAELAFTKA